MKASDNINITGILSIVVSDREGKIISSFKEHNMIVNGGYISAAKAMAGVADAIISQVAVGTSPTQPTVDDTMITDAVAVNIDTIEYPKPGTVRFGFTFDYNTANGLSIVEFGLLTRDGTLFSRKVRSAAIEKTEYMTITGIWDINF